jgi:glycosyltransferase A (GT-A) superfamily protein (DUF2064 family)
MEKAMAPFPRAILIGSDIPGLGPADIAAGFRALGKADAVFGPALDGGYWLVGFGPRRPHCPFAKVRWSSPHALADTLANLVCPVRRLMSDDLPTLERPMKANSGTSGSGQPSRLVALITNWAERICMKDPQTNGV